MLDNLSSSLKNTLKKITDAIFVDEKLVNELVKDIQRSLIKADVNVKLVLSLTQDIKKRALEEEIPKGISKKEHLVNIVYEELVKLLGDDKQALTDKIKKKKTYKIMLVGLFGSGKTTSIAKLSSYFKKRGYTVGVVTTDTWRPAAYDQLEQLAKKTKVDFFGDKSLKDPVKVYKKFEKEYSKYDLLLVDTAGRDALNKELITEIKKLNKAVSPDDTFLVLSGDIGQGAENQAKSFHENCGVTGVIISKLDGTAKGGGALIACSVTGAPVRFIGTGEKIDDLEDFKPSGFVGRLLGMGDLEALLEKTRFAVDEEEVEDLSKKFLKGDFNLIDMYEQMKAMKKMGPLNKIMDLIPGMSGKVPDHMLKGQEEKIGNWKFLMQSMTKEELEDPTIMNSRRVQRVANGSGMETKDVRELLKQYKQSKKMMKMMKPGSSEKDIQKMMQKMQSKGLR